MTNERQLLDFIHYIDDGLMLIEDAAKGEYGDAITKLRHEISRFLATLPGEEKEREDISFAEWVHNNTYPSGHYTWCIRGDNEEKDYSMKELYQMFKKKAFK